MRDGLRRLSTIFCWLIGGVIGWLVLSQPAMAETLVSGEFGFTWQVPGELEPAGFDLLINDEPFLTNIGNQAGSFDDYTLFYTQRTSGKYYRLILITSLAAGEHNWQIVAHDYNREPLMVTPVQSMNIAQDNPPWQVLMSVVLILWHTQVLWTTLQLVLTVLLTIGLILCLIFYSLIIISKLIVTRGRGLKQILGWRSQDDRNGLVFDVETGKGVPFALLTVKSVGEEKALTETLVTDVEGVYTPPALPIGRYLFSVECPGYTFPVTNSRAEFMTQSEFYRGEEIVVKTAEKIVLNIPMNAEDAESPNNDKQHGGHKHSWRNDLSLFIQGTWKQLARLHFILLALSVAAMVWQPSILYGISIGFFGLLATTSWFGKHRQYNFNGVIVDGDGLPLEAVIVSVYALETNHLVAVTTTDRGGHFGFSLPTTTYRVIARKEDFVMTQDGQPAMAGVEMIVDGDRNLKVIVLQPRPKSTSDDWLRQD